MRKLLLTLWQTVLLCACAHPMAAPPDGRVGTERTPYQSIPVVVECGACALPPRP